jgi:hypothetical protein
MTNTLKSFVNCESLSLEESFQGSCFGHVFYKAYVNMAQHMKKCAKVSNIYLLNLHKQICKSASLGPKYLKRVSKSEKKLVLKLVYTQGS